MNERKERSGQSRETIKEERKKETNKWTGKKKNRIK